MKAITPAVPIDKKTLLKTMRNAALAAGGGHLVMKKFLAGHSLKPRDISRHFATWREALIAAGIQTKSPTPPVDDGTLLTDWGKVAGESGRIPSMREYNLRGKHGVSTLTNRFGKWKNIPGAFRAYAARLPEWTGLLKTLFKTPAKQEHPERARPRTGQRLAGRPACGRRINLEALSHSPVNEQGVVYLFGHLAPRLGIVAEAFQAGFPDCLAKRLVGHDIWQNMHIEFEYESRSFRAHGHSPDGCDLIVCWEHNWPDCPKNLEVIALSEELNRLGHISKQPGGLQELDSWRGRGARAATAGY